MKSVLIVALAVLSFVGCRREDVKDEGIEVEVVGMKESDLDFVVGRIAGIPYHARSGVQILGGYKGVRDTGVNPESKSPTRVIEVGFNPATQRLKMKYDSMQIAEKNIEMVIAEAGFVVRRVVRDKDGKDLTAEQRPILPSEVGLMICTVEVPEMTAENMPLILERLIGIPYYSVRVQQGGRDMMVKRRCQKGDDFHDFEGGLKGLRDACRPNPGYPCANPPVRVETNLSAHCVTFRYLLRGSEDSARADIHAALEVMRDEQDHAFRVANIVMRPFVPVSEAK